MLNIVSHHSQQLGEASACVFDERGGVIGRDRLADWHIEDPSKGLSGRHARVLFVDCQFCIEDTSTNGTALGRPDRLIPRERLTPLRDGDLLYMGDFEILVQVIGDPDPPRAAAPAPAASPPPLPFPPAAPYAPAAPPVAPTAPAVRAMAAPLGVPPPMVSSPLAGFPPPPPTAPSPAPASFSPPPPMAPPAGHGGAGASSADAGIEALYGALGLDPRLVPPETTAQIGAILRTVTQGLVEVLQARAEVKNQFRINATVLRLAEYNPLKVASDYPSAMQMLFLARNPGFLGPVEAFAEALEDLRNHELAVLAGMQAAFRAVIERFDPEQIELNLKNSGRAGGLFDGGKTRSWDYFREMYALVAKDPDSAFTQLFTPAFIHAYEDQIRRMKAVPPARRPGG